MVILIFLNSFIIEFHIEISPPVNDRTLNEINNKEVIKSSV